MSPSPGHATALSLREVPRLGLTRAGRFVSGDEGAGGSAGHLARMDRYVAGLSGGLDAHPGARCKGSVVRNLLERQPITALLPLLPPPLRRLAEDPPMAGEWLPEVHFMALLLALADFRQMADREVLAWIRERNRALFRSPTYRILMAVASPSVLVRFAGGRWSNWHRGSELIVDGVADDGVHVLLRFPPGLFDGLMLRVFAEAFAAALETANARSPEVAVTEEGKGFARYAARW